MTPRSSSQNSAPPSTGDVRSRRPVIAAFAALVAIDAFAGAAGEATRVVAADPQVIAALPEGSAIVTAYALVLVVGIPMSVLAVMAVHGHPSVDVAAMAAGGLLAAWSVLKLLLGTDSAPVTAVLGSIGVIIAAVGYRNVFERRDSRLPESSGSRSGVRGRR